jgi:hypothetical protein
MQNFYDLTDTKSIAISICLDINKCETNPNVIVLVNDCVLFDAIFSTHVELNTTIDVKDNLNVSIVVRHDNEQKHSSVLISKITADGFAIMPNHNYLATYTNAQNNTSPTSELGLAGKWEIDTKQPLLWWIHEISGHGWLLKP